MIFGIGLPKTGNTSLAAFLKEQGLIGVQYPSYFQWQDLSCFDFVVDTPCNLYYRGLYTAFPDAKFIYTYRDDISWLRSFAYHLSSVEILDEWRIQNRDKLFPSNAYIKDKWRHEREVNQFFLNNPNFLLLDINAPDKIHLLAKFLGLSPQHSHYPHLHQRPSP